ncbi:hypothetical protein BME96_08920 [Virgibacillus halodenitrificans]|uniref:Uncharacterized protein n=1 Tax=Virgibacillus halodenitrificans TaxID=1482 RepID=A0AAC9J0G0_VIRHA|nr:hypothetical protein [Virgibacillus halodenitrificans]APC48282.1 hypothetical protein BME96_08920 [Virgibacillus halodenitrificans]
MSDVILLESKCQGFWECITPDAWVTSLGTLLGALIGALLGAFGAIYATKVQHSKLIDRQNKEKDFEFTKRYNRISFAVNSVIRRINYHINGKMSETFHQSNLNILKVTIEKFDNFPLELITMEKYDSFIKCHSNILDYQALLENKKEGIKEDNEQELLISIRDSLIKEHNYLIEQNK